MGGDTGSSLRALNVAEDDERAQAAVDRYRDIAKWLITVFAAVGGVLVAGSQLTSIGSLDLSDDRGRLAAALLGLALALGMAVVMISSTLRVLEPLPLFVSDVTNDAELARELDRRPQRLPFGASSVADLEAKLSTAMRSAGLDDAEKERWRVEARRFVRQARVVKVRNRFRGAWRRMAWAAPVATVGIVLFAYAANPPEDEVRAGGAPPAVLPAPRAVDVHLTPAGVQALRSALGAQCVERPVAALVTGGTTLQPQVVVPPTSACRTAQFVLDPVLGLATAA